MSPVIYFEGLVVQEMRSRLRTRQNVGARAAGGFWRRLLARGHCCERVSRQEIGLQIGAPAAIDSEARTRYDLSVGNELGGWRSEDADRSIVDCAAVGEGT